MNTDLVCEGGGVKGIALLGAACCLEDNGYTFNQLAGSSAGAILSSLLAVGYTCNELKYIVLNLDFKKFQVKNSLSSIPLIGPTINLIKNKGLFSADMIEYFLNEKFKEKGKTKFIDISVNGVSPLKITASDITRKELLILPDDLIKYNIDPMNFEISKAVRMSISLPIYFTPVLLNGKDSSSYIVDGGLLSNFPIWLFDVKGIPRWPTFGLKLVSDKDKNIIPPSKSTVITYSLDILETILQKNEEVYLNNKNSIRTISIPTYDIGTTDFFIPYETRLKLFNSGYDTTKSFLKSWDFQNYLKKYRLL